MEIKVIKHQLYILMLTISMSISYVSANEVEDWDAMSFIDVNAMDWDETWSGLKGTSKGKKLYSNDQGGFMLYLDHDHGWDSLNKSRHFHDFH